MSADGSSIRKPMDGFAASVMVCLCLLWGLQQVAIKAAAPQMNPILQVGLRSFLAALLVAGLMLVRRESLSLRDGTLRPGILVGALFAGEFLVVAWGLNYTTAGHMAVFLYTAPIFTALGLNWRVKSERLSQRQWWGVVLAFIGIVVGYSGSFFVPGGKNLLLGDALGIAGGLLWAATTLVIRGSTLSEAPPSKTLLYQLAGAGLLLLPVAFLRGNFEGIGWSWSLVANLTFQTVIIAFASYLFWFWLLRKYLATRLSIFSFLTPLFGVALGVTLLEEPLDPRFVIGAVLVLAGITVVNRKG